MSKTSYAIPKQNEGYVQNIETYAEEKVKKLCDNIQKVRTNAKLVKGFSIIEFENKFIPLLDEGYLSYLIGLYHSTISLWSIAMERLCYDLVENSQIEFDGKELDYEQKKSLFQIPFMKLIDFLRKIGKINGQIYSDMVKLNKLRNEYVHPLLEGDLLEDATKSINLLCRIIETYRTFIQ